MGPQLTVHIIEVSLFQSVHNSRFDCISIINNIITIITYTDNRGLPTVDPLVWAW